MRFEKGTDFVEITDGISTDKSEGAVWFVESSLDFKGLPIEFRERIQKSDTERYQKLKNAVSSWA